MKHSFLIMLVILILTSCSKHPSVGDYYEDKITKKRIKILGVGRAFELSAKTQPVSETKYYYTIYYRDTSQQCVLWKEEIGSVIFYHILSIHLLNQLYVYSDAVGRDKLEIGQTYSDVEKLLGKPQKIERGMKEFEVPLWISFDTSGFHPKKWRYRQRLETKEKDLYVSWIFPPSKIDTFFLLNHRWSKVDTEYYRICKNFTIVFDAASGRIIEYGWRPTEQDDITYEMNKRK